MQQTDDTEVPEAVREFRRHLERMQWDSLAFARAARIKPRNAGEMFRGMRPVPEPVMGWLRSMVATADRLPPPPPPSDP